jgi:hypothetical protein
VPPVAGARLPKLNVLAPAPPLTFSVPVVAWILNVSLPLPLLSVVTADDVLSISRVTLPEPIETFKADKPE